MTSNSEWLNPILSLLSRSSSQCLTCGKQGRSSSLYPAICVTCAGLIPWIRHPRCPQCGRHVGCPDCTRGGEPSPILCNRSAVAYNSIMRQWLGQYKYRGNEGYAPLLGIMLVKAYQLLRLERQNEAVQHPAAKTELNNPANQKVFIRTLQSLLLRDSISSYSWQADALVPVPVSEARLVERGFNQAERLADELSRHIGIPVLQLLKRTHHTGKQSFKGRAERLSNMQHAFAPDPLMQQEYANWLHLTQHLEIRPVRLIVIDDIYTTGSTVRACAESVRRMTETCGYSADIYSLTLARS